ncbi:integrase [Aureimonas endophytica]|uniref:Integrase n=1 Tax=Aureimonas endophytica TaxID=2027858 RepID=A0A917EAV4_9HYPH|nr:integrase family protein [Aureimonas endophytica]GGE19910.1 integrase [Aureimonas endophytica]
MSLKVRLSDAAVARIQLDDGKNDMVVWDTDVTGFGLRIRPGGKTWILAYRPAGTGRSGIYKRMKLGSVTTIRSTSEARNLARIALGQIARGEDPLATRKKEREAEKAKLADLIDRYEKDLIRRNYVGAELHTRNLRTKMKHMLARDIRTITGAEYAKVIERLETAGKAGAAKDFRARCRAFLTWCVSKAQVLSTNPLAGHRKERATRADRVAKAEHGRALSDTEIVKLWRASDPATVYGRLVRFWLLTGCRRGEGAGLEWAMIDRKAKLIRLPAVFTKQGRGHDVPITPALAALLDACPVDARSDLVFASPRTGGLISGWTQITERANKAAGVVFHFHDLRRTFRTGLSRLGIDTETAELAIGHARAELLQIYDRDRGEDRVRAAFEAWAKHIEKLVAAAENVEEKPLIGAFS